MERGSRTIVTTNLHLVTIIVHRLFVIMGFNLDGISSWGRRFTIVDRLREHRALRSGPQGDPWRDQGSREGVTWRAAKLESETRLLLTIRLEKYIIEEGRPPPLSSVDPRPPDGNCLSSFPSLSLLVTPQDVDQSKYFSQGSIRAVYVPLSGMEQVTPSLLRHLTSSYSRPDPCPSRSRKDQVLDPDCSTQTDLFNGQARPDVK